MCVIQDMYTPETIHKALLSAWNSRDFAAFAAFAALMHPEYGYMGGDGKLITGGPEVGVGIGKMFANAFPDGQLQLLSVCTGENRAACEFVATGTHDGELMGVPASGRPINIRVANIVEMRDGLIYREYEYIDMMTMMTQMGAMPAAAAA